jgi:ABC-2 type transport system ATP-binding protein
MDTILTSQSVADHSISPDDAVITAEKLTKRYRRLVAVNNLNLSIPRGCVFGLIGPNGAGKTTLIKMLMGLIKISSGRATVLGLDVAQQADRIHRIVGYVPETHTIYRWMTVGEVIHFCRAFRDTWNDDLCKELLDTFELNPDQKVKHLSKGMLSKLSLLLALAYEPEVLMLDEPTLGLDLVIREEFVDSILNEICRRQCTVLFSSHAIEDVERIADRVGLIFNGQLQLDVPVKDLLSTTRRVRAVLKNAGPPKSFPAESIWQQIDGREWLLTITNFTSDTISHLQAANGLENVEVEEISLSQFFKDYVKGRRAKKCSPK